MAHFSDAITKLLIRGRWWWLLLGVVLAVVSYPSSRKVAYDRSIENMFASDDPLLVPYQRLKAQFGGNEIVLAVYDDPALLDPDGDGLKRVAELSNQLRDVPGVRAVLSLAEVNEGLEGGALYRAFLKPIRGIFAVDAWDAITKTRSSQPAILESDSALAQAYLDLFEGYTHGDDGRTVAVACMLLSEDQTTTPRRHTIDRLRDLVGQMPEGQIAGEPVMVVDGFRYVEQDGRRLGWATTGLLALTIVALFRSLRWVLIPIAVVQLTLLTTRATLNLSQLRLSMVSSMLTAIVTVVGVATVVHVIVRFREARSQGLAPQEALAQAGRILVAPVFWACATDAIGFLALMFADVGPVHDFGVMMAVGSMLVLLSVALLVPGMAIWGGVDTDPQHAWGEKRLGAELGRLIGWVHRRPWTLTTGLIALAVLFVAGTNRLQVETDFTKNFRRYSPIVSSYQFVESRLGGAGVWDLLLPAPDTLDVEYLQRVSDLEDQLRALRVVDAHGRSEPGLSKVISLADAVQASDANPLLRRVPLELRVRGMARVMPEFMAALRHRNPQGPDYIRVMLRARESQPAEQKLWLIDQVRSLAEQQFPGSPAAEPGQVTGFFVLLSNLIESMLRDQWTCFALATLGIGLMMLLAFRSLSLAAIALVPNALPILMVMGLMGWLDLKINMGAAMIAAVSMGLSVDSSIHYIIAYQRARRQGKPLLGALQDVQQTVGRAMVFSTLALIIGFSVLCASQFVPTIYFGALVSLSMLGGLVGNLLALPLLLSLTQK